jgi:hypothetical protein
MYHIQCEPSGLDRTFQQASLNKNMKMHSTASTHQEIIYIYKVIEKFFLTPVKNLKQFIVGQNEVNLYHNLSQLVGFNSFLGKL